MYHMTGLVMAAGVFLLSSAAPAAARVDAVSAPGHLPKTVRPISYDISVAPDLTAMKIRGNERIDVDVLRPTARIVMDAVQTQILSARLDGVPAANVRVDERAQTVTMTFAHAVRPGHHQIALAYIATVQTSSQGLFRQQYRDENGKPAQMIATQMESTDARRMFPGWDEPAFRAKFHLTATVPAAWTAVSNMPVEKTAVLGANKRVTFQTTPSMSTYLLVLCAGDFESVSGSAAGTKVTVYGTKGKAAQLTYARDSLVRLIPYFNRYYGVKYPLPKLDIIAVPGGFDGAMENWGGMTFQETTLLYDPKLQSPSAKRRVFDIIAHETSHQWNGDLVTMAWWDGLWLNEGFATWMEAKATADNNPGWNWWLGFDASTDGAMFSDARKTTHPIQVPVHNDTEAAEVFDEISYQKAGAFLRMLEAYLGPQTFRAGFHDYLIANAYGNTEPQDLWSALSRVSHRNVSKIAAAWIDKGGFPVVDASASCHAGKRVVRLTQHAYSADGTGSGTIWEIPLRMEVAPGKMQSVLMTGRTATIAAGLCTQPLVLNGDSIGYYRVRYDASQRALQQRFFKTLSVADRINLLDDAWAFAQDGNARLADYLAYVNADRGDLEPHVLAAILGNLGSMRTYERNQRGEQAFNAYLRGYLRPLLAQLGGWDARDANQERDNLRMEVIGLLAGAGDQATIAQGQKRFAEFLKDPSSLQPPLKSVVLTIAGRYADAATYQQLLRLGMSARDAISMQQYFGALFAAKDEALAKQNLQMALQLPPQFASFAPFIVMAVGQDHPQLAWEFLQENKTKLFAPLSAFERTGAVAGIASSFWQGVPAGQIEAFLRANVPPAASKEIAKAMEGVHLSLQHRKRLLPQIDAYAAMKVAPPAGTAGK